MTLRKSALIGALLIAVLPSLSMRWTDAYKVLSEADIKLEKDQTDPALSSAIDERPHWESFNRWLCFYSDEVETLCADVCWRPDSCAAGGWEKEPIISVLHRNHLYEFEDESRFDQPPCEEIQRRWKMILNRQSVVCIFAAHLQDNEVSPEEGFKRHSTWILSRVKTYGGEWQTKDSEKPNPETKERSTTEGTGQDPADP